MRTYKWLWFIYVIVWGTLVYVVATKLNRNKSSIEIELIQPSLENEHSRRQVRKNAQEIWNYFSSEMGKVRGNLGASNISEKIHKIIELGAEYKRSLISDIDQMRSDDGYEMWRQKEAKNLSAIVQKRLYYLQNPVNCASANMSIIPFRKFGFAAQLHIIVNCFIKAYARGRTMILKSKGWRYHTAGWEEIFEQISEECTYSNLIKTSKMKKNIYPYLSFSTKNFSSSHEKNSLFTDSLSGNLAKDGIPGDLAPRLLKLHGDPSVWWISQFLKYLLKLRLATRKMIKIRMSKLGWKKPIVGVHVRRSDKIGYEASYHSVEEYMTYVEDYYLTQEMKNINVERRIVLATDDPEVITETRMKYPQYTIIGDPDVAKTANFSTRYTDLYGIISDIYMLALSDYLVCTFSSNVCRMAYEIMQIYYPDASDRFKSLDNLYHFGSQFEHDVEVILPHNSRNKDEIHIKPGDIINIAGNLWDGFSQGTIRQTRKLGIFPSFKVKNKIKILKLPIYENNSSKI